MKNSDLIVREMMTQGWDICRGCGTTTLSKVGGASYIATPGGNDGGHPPLYFATSSDPVYRVAGCSGQGAFVNGKLFHAPSGAPYSQGDYDGGITIWDQSTNELFTFYHNGTGASLPACDSHDPRHPCSFDPGNGYCSWGNWENSHGYMAGSASSTAGLAPFAGRIRMQELQQAGEGASQIYHALRLLTLCTGNADGVYPSKMVFPAKDGGWTAQTCATVQSNRDPTFRYRYRPPNGSLVFLDYTDANLSYLRTALPKWQYPIIEALTHYGGYIEDTGAYGGVYPLNSVESGEAYKFYDSHGVSGAWKIAQNFYDWLNANCRTKACVHSTRRPPGSSDVWSLYAFYGIPVVDGRDILGHMHIADPCVAKSLAGLGACTNELPRKPRSVTHTH